MMDLKDLSDGVWLVCTRDHDCKRYLDRSPVRVETGSLWQVTGDEPGALLLDAQMGQVTIAVAHTDLANWKWSQSMG
jgi:hypothetical protein